MKYTVSKTKKNVTVTRRGSRGKQSLPVQAAHMALDFPEAPLGAICDNPEMLRLSHAPNQIDKGEQLGAIAELEFELVTGNSVFLAYAKSNLLITGAPQS